MFTRSGAVAAIAFAAMVSAFAACSDASELPSAPDGVGPHFTKRGITRSRSATVSPQRATIEVGAGIRLTASAPHDPSAAFAWSSSDSAIASVDGTGFVRGVGVGTATIQATASAGSGAATVTVVAAPPPGTAVLIAAGDIAGCSNDYDEATARLLDVTAGTVAALGDNAYPVGSLGDYWNCYEPTWGRHKNRTRPALGNHEYRTPAAGAYFGYFGSVAGDPAKGYYSYELGEWHVVVLNSSADCVPVSCSRGSAQERWLRADLAANSKRCVLAYWHHPRFSSGALHGNDTTVAPFWEALYDYDADVILNGHEHIYERFAPQTPNAISDAVHGIRQFTVGTGGRGHYALGTIKANSETRNATSYGVLKLSLRAGSYDWQFLPIAGNTFHDSGTADCH